ncbi:hypothetical protein QOT17_020359 [Balamuthia mandrillaris]
MQEGREDERRRTRGKKGIKTKATIRDNTYDRHYTSPKPILYFPNEADVPYSINKAKRWELVEEVKQQVCHTCEHVQEDELWNGVADEGREKHCKEGIPDIREVMEVQLRESQDIGEKSFRSLGSNDPSHGYFPGGCWGKEKGGRDFVRVTVTLGACNECHNPDENVFASTTAAATTNEGEVQDETKEQQNEAKRLLRKERNKAKVEKKDLHRKHHETPEEKEEAHEHEEEDQEEEADCEEDSEDEVEETLEGVQVVKTQERKLAQVKDGRVIVQQPFEKGQYPLYRETNWKYSTPCKGCLYSYGGIWLTKGMGDKSKGKTKGQHRVKQNEWNSYLRGEL